MEKLLKLGIAVIIMVCLTACKTKNSDEINDPTEIQDYSDETIGHTDEQDNSIKTFLEDNTEGNESVVIELEDSGLETTFDEDTGILNLDGLSYELGENGEALLYSYVNDSFENLTVPEEIEFEGKTYTVTAIGEEAFLYYYDLKEVILPDSITEIGDSAFYGCFDLTDITLSASLKSIGESAFYDCNSLSMITLPDGLLSIGDWAFSECTSLPDMVLPDSVSTLGIEVFYGCIALESIQLSGGLSSISDGTFISCEILSSCIIPESVTVIGEDAFWDCISLKELTLPKNIEEIGERAFYNTGLTSITLPPGFITEDEELFSYCDDFKTLYVSSDMLNYYKKLFDSDYEITIVDEE